MELRRKKCKTAILLYCFHAACELHTFVLHNLLGPGHIFIRKNVLENYFGFSKWNLWQPVMYSQIHFNIRFTIHSRVQFSIYCISENWIEGGGNRVSVHFAVTFLDCWRTSFCVTTIIKIVNNNTNDIQTFGASLALDEDSLYTNSCLFTIDRLPLLLLLR